MKIKTLDLADETELRGYAEVRIAAQTADRPREPAPSPERIIESLRETSPGFSGIVRLVALLDGEVAGVVSAGLLERLATGSITVHPRHRRRGIGTALLEALLPELRAAGREALEDRVAPGSAGEHWALTHGFQVTASRVVQQLTVADVDPVSWELPAPAGYRVERWTGETPEHLLVSLAATRRAIHDAPDGDHAPEWTPELVRAEEAQDRAAGVERRAVVAVEEATGHVAAFTNVRLYPEDVEHTFWQDTVVAPRHRGRGLARFVKAQLLPWLLADRPELERIETGTASANAPMIRTNEALGFVTTREVVVVSRSV
ncbi:GNAT family N-acetyltransferase [Lentzea flava]|uniref:GNAT family N-acetyltransferase n=1 Tax=Lentzea flava TaxID=103732 RepID=A0ABQ2V5B2_9PSEU|nr:GNAT family N-acetyltransferase [Lentzea flava]MCP2203590.1 Acetyltransferase (GNAT) family protein [Lentzea flava]GGU69571.1 GNAT family N-acetyltransferase [Lentzea flava]